MPYNLTDTLLVTAGLVDEDDLPMDSPHFGFDPSVSPGPGAIGQPTSYYGANTNYPASRKADDLGLSHLLAQSRLTDLRSEYSNVNGDNHMGGSRWEDWSRQAAVPRTAPLFPTSDPQSLGAVPMLQAQQNNRKLSPGIDTGAQATHHLQALQSLLGPLAQQAEEVESLRKEVGMWKEAWEKANKETKRAELALEQKAENHTGPPFSVMLIDGDGLIFQDEHLKSGFQGGQTAAKTLLSSIPEMLSHACISPTNNDFGRELSIPVPPNDLIKAAGAGKDGREPGSVVVHIFLNKSGLGQTLVKAGIVPSWQVYESFFQGLSAAHELISVVDVGPGKEATDAKIRALYGTGETPTDITEHLRLYAKNAQCEMIVLGASHDNGYANVLSSLHTENRLSNFLLLKGYADLAGQLRQYSSRVVTIPDLFRTTKIPVSFSSIAAQPIAPPTPTTFPAVPSPTILSAAPGHGQNQGNKKSAKSTAVGNAGSPTSVAVLPKARNNSAVSEGSVEVIEWNQVGKKGKDDKKSHQTSGAGYSKDKDGYKYGGEGKKGKKSKKGYTVRNLDPRPCHTYYLSDRGCKAGDECDYAHHYDLNDDDVEELRKLAKEMVCPYVRNNKCHFTEEDCVYG